MFKSFSLQCNSKSNLLPNVNYFFNFNNYIENYNIEKEKLQSIMAFGKVTKLDPVVLPKKHASQKMKTECSEEELINSGYNLKYYIIYLKHNRQNILILKILIYFSIRISYYTTQITL